MASTFDIGGGPRSNKNLVSDCPGGGGGGGCAVTLSGPWTIVPIQLFSPKYWSGFIFISFHISRH